MSLSLSRKEYILIMWIKFNPNPVNARVGDCAVRAIAKALDITWEKAFVLIAKNGFQMGDIMASNNVWGSVLRQNGFYRHTLPTECPDCYTVRDFCFEHPKGLYVLGCANHVVTCEDGNYYDTWDSGDEVVIYYWSKGE